MQQLLLNQKYNVGAYERLSKEDDNKEESSSIENQKMIIESFAKFNKLSITKHYSDDGFTGSNFNRPGFEKLKNDIEKGLINCVIVKDLSRLGRELYLTGLYIEDYFLSKNVRFIAINDGYDSLVGDSMLGIRLSVNDMYLRDTSKKIRSSLDEKRRRGDYIGSFATYGYIKNPKNPKQLIIDPNTVDIVRQIFKWAANGMGTTSIAYKLTSMNILVPSVYKNLKNASNSDGIWRPQTIKLILENEIYLGHMIQGRWKKPSYNIKGCKEVKDKNNWFIVKNTHEPIIDEETFNKVQKNLKSKSRYRCNKEDNRHLLQGLLYCKECGNKIGILKSKSNHLNIQCYTYSKYSKYHKCLSHHGSYHDLEMIVLQYLKNIINNFLKTYNSSSIFTKCKDILNEDLHKLELQKYENKKLIEKNIKLSKQLYIDKVEGIISISQYKILSKDIDESISKLQLDNKYLEEKIKNYNTINIDEINDIIYKYPFLSNELILEIVDKIIIDKDLNIEIFFKVDISNFQ